MLPTNEHNIEIIKGYSFSTEEEAKLAVEKTNEYYNISSSEDKVTNSWVNYNVTFFNNPRIYYIIWHESLTPVLGEPKDLELIIKA
jgi:hypothetical protein